jgi:hypothetical protein
MRALAGLVSVVVVLGCAGANLDAVTEAPVDEPDAAEEFAEAGAEEVVADDEVEGPVAVAERYLRAGAEGRLDDARALLEDGCDKQQLLNVAPTHVLGARLTLDSLEVQADAVGEAEATVSYRLQGKTSGGGGVDTKMGKMKLKINVGSMDASMERSGHYTLLKTEHGWRVDCGS